MIAICSHICVIIRHLAIHDQTAGVIIRIRLATIHNIVTGVHGNGAVGGKGRLNAVHLHIDRAAARDIDLKIAGNDFCKCHVKDLICINISKMYPSAFRLTVQQNAGQIMIRIRGDLKSDIVARSDLKDFCCIRHRSDDGAIHPNFH